MRLQKFLASAGLGSRRHCEELIADGRVDVDGVTVEKAGVRIDPDSQKVVVDGTMIRSEKKEYYLLNKPTGYLCTHSDPSGRSRAVDLIPSSKHSLSTVGRLDANSEGLLLITNDGELANRLAHPRFQVERAYRIQVAGRPTQNTLDLLKKGIYFPEGKFRVQRIRKVGVRGQSTILELVLKEGKNREIRRILAKVGHKVMHLQRIRFGPLKLGRLKIGQCKRLSRRELSELEEFSRQTPQQRSIQRKRRPAKKTSKRTTKHQSKIISKRTSKRTSKSTGKKKSPQSRSKRK